MIQKRYSGKDTIEKYKTLDNSDLTNLNAESPHPPSRPLQHVGGDFLRLIQYLIQSLNVYPDLLAVKKPYSDPVLHHYDKNLSKRWYIDFYVWSEIEQRKVRVRKWVGKGENADTIDTRLDKANRLIYFFKTALENGLITPDPPKEHKVKKGVSLHAMMEQVFKIKEAQTRGTSTDSYRTVCRNFTRFWEDRGGLENVRTLEKVNILEYLNHRQIKDGIENGTRNKELSFLKTLFNIGIELKYLDENPCVGIKMLKVERSKDRVYTEDEMILLREAYGEAYKDLRLFVDFIYYCYMRPKREVRFMRVSHINVKDKVIYIPAENSKNGRARYVKMPVTLLKHIEKSGVLNQEPEFFVFGNQKRPGARAYGKNTMYDRHAKIAKRLKIDGDLYSWKHTGIFMAYKQGLRMKDISMQCGHSDLNETDRYFNKNGFYDLERNFEFK